MKCLNCGYEGENFTFCPVCYQNIDSQVTICLNCGEVREDKSSECPKCGIDFNSSQYAVKELVELGRNTPDKPIKYTKRKNLNSNLKNKYKKIVLIISVVVVALILVILGVHRCEECEEIFIGMGYTYTSPLIGEEVLLCDDCYNEIYDYYYGWLY